MRDMIMGRVGLLIAAVLVVSSCRTTSPDSQVDQTDPDEVFNDFTLDLGHIPRNGTSDLNLQDEKKDGKVCCACYFSESQTCELIAKKETCEQNFCKWFRPGKGKKERCGSRMERACYNWLKADKQKLCEVKSVLNQERLRDPFLGHRCSAISLGRQGHSYSGAITDAVHLLKTAAEYHPNVLEFAIQYDGCRTLADPIASMGQLVELQSGVKPGQKFCLTGNQLSGNGEGRTTVSGKVVDDPITSYLTIEVTSDGMRLVLHPCGKETCFRSQHGIKTMCHNKDGNHFQTCCCKRDESGNYPRRCPFRVGEDKCEEDPNYPSRQNYPSHQNHQVPGGPA